MTAPSSSVAIAPDLRFSVEGADVVPYTAVPMVGFRLTVEETRGMQVRSIYLRTQIRLQPTGRRYEPAEQARLFDLFGPSAEWGRTMQSLLWMTTVTLVPGFEGRTTAELPVPVSHDFDIAATKYLASLDGGRAPLDFLFSGSVFFEADGRLQVVQLSWDQEARFALPVETWRAALDEHCPGSAWVRIGRSTFDRLWRYRSARALPTWDDALLEVLPDEPWTERR